MKTPGLSQVLSLVVCSVVILLAYRLGIERGRSERFEATRGEATPRGDAPASGPAAASATGPVNVLVREGRERAVFRTQPGTNNLVRIRGTSTLHDWEVRGRILAGSFEVEGAFPLDPSRATPGRVAACVALKIPVKSLKSVQKDGTPYSTAMDNILYEKLQAERCRTIDFSLTELHCTEPGVGELLRLEARGVLTVAGTQREVTVPVTAVVSGPTIRFLVETGVNMSDFGVEPPSPSIPGGSLIKTGDFVKLDVEWTVLRKEP